MKTKWDWAFAQRVPPAEKLVLLELTDHANSSGKECYPRQIVIAERTGQSQSTVKRSISSLIGRGILTKKARRKGGFQRSNLYKLNLSTVVGQGVIVTLSDGSPWTPARGHGELLIETPYETPIETPNCGEPQMEEDLGKNIQDVLDGFEPLPKDEIIAKAHRHENGDLKASGCAYLWRRFRVTTGASGFQPEMMIGELGMLGKVRDRIDNDDLFIEAMWVALTNWIAFTKHAQSKGGAYQLPQTPKLGFFVKYCAEAVDFAQSGGGSVSDDFVHVIAKAPKPLTKPAEVGENKEVMTHEQILEINAEFDD